ncbi:MAG: hypothetical protein HY080_10245 [Gammaproteobacteria bacterium]|nr:hypothetical protein [Gammaproteobacteria bacterium]
MKTGFFYSLVSPPEDIMRVPLDDQGHRILKNAVENLGTTTSMMMGGFGTIWEHTRD